MGDLSISAGFRELMEQASAKAESYLVDGIRMIDSKLGEGYAAEHPELLATFMRVAGDDFRTSVVLKLLVPVGVDLAQAVGDASCAISSMSSAIWEIARNRTT